MTNNTEQRRAFEDGYLGPLCRERYADTGKYRDGAVERDWILFQVGWQAALAQREQEAPDNELPGMWEKADFEGGKPPVIRGPAPSLCTAEEAAELEHEAAGWHVGNSDYELLAAIINADRARR
jgi:hypothetical protein